MKEVLFHYGKGKVGYDFENEKSKIIHISFRILIVALNLQQK